MVADDDGARHPRDSEFKRKKHVGGKVKKKRVHVRKASKEEKKRKELADAFEHARSKSTLYTITSSKSGEI